MNLATLADIKTSHAKAIVEQVVITAEHLLAIINDYPIHKALIADVQRDINTNVSRMVNTSLRR